jgi:hypothetical protein
MRIELLLQLIKHYANNPATFILPNDIRSEARKLIYQEISAKKHDYIIVQSRPSETACAITAQGLLTAMTDPLTTLNKIPREKDESGLSVYN